MLPNREDNTEDLDAEGRKAGRGFRLVLALALVLALVLDALLEPLNEALLLSPSEPLAVVAELRRILDILDARRVAGACVESPPRFIVRSILEDRRPLVSRVQNARCSDGKSS